MFFLKEKKIVVLKQENLFCNGTISEEGGGGEINNCWGEKRGVKFGQASLREKFHNIQKDAKQSKVFIQ